METKTVDGVMYRKVEASEPLCVGDALWQKRVGSFWGECGLTSDNKLIGRPRSAWVSDGNPLHEVWRPLQEVQAFEIVTVELPLGGLADKTLPIGWRFVEQGEEILPGDRVAYAYSVTTDLIPGWQTSIGSDAFSCWARAQPGVRVMIGDSYRLLRRVEEKVACGLCGKHQVPADKDKYEAHREFEALLINGQLKVVE